MNVLLPTLFGANYYQFANKSGCQIEYFYPEFVEIDKGMNNELQDDVIQEQDEYLEKSYDETNNNEFIHGFNNNRVMGNNFNMYEEEEEDDLISNNNKRNKGNGSDTRKFNQRHQNRNYNEFT